MKLLQRVFVGVGSIVIVAASAATSYWVMSITVGQAQETPTAQAQPKPVVVEPTELVIKEWSVVIPLQSSISDARYYMSPTIGPDTITVTTKRSTDLLGKVEGCRTGLYGSSISRSTISTKPTGRAIYLQTSTHRFEAPAVIEPACKPSTSDVPADLLVILSDIEDAIAKMHVQ